VKVRDSSKKMKWNKIKTELSWEIEVCVFSLAIVLARIQPDSLNEFDGGIVHKCLDEELVAYCSALEWGSDVDVRLDGLN